jgi:hypothetical protein
VGGTDVRDVADRRVHVGGGSLALAVSERVVAYSFDQFTAQPALDRIALAPGSG